MKLMANIKERIRRTGYSIITFYAFLVTFTLIIPFIVSLLNDEPIVVSDTMYIIVPTLFYSLFVGVIMINAGFNMAIQFGSKRSTIFKSYVVSSVIISFVMTVVNDIYSLILDKIGNGANTKVADILFKVSNYSFENNLLDFLLIILVLSLGMIAGLILKRYKKEYLVIIAACLVFSPMLIIYIFRNLSNEMQNTIVRLLKVISGVQGPNIWALIGTVTVLYMLCNVISWAIIRRQPAK
ncbi:hypothetical protein [Companilactobacillus sp. DQM5]|uniref:hypothetical protein n=1 Tax=Companilactobacillus sp. DQM5 TaxID=3463359 RepID=UPI0040597196